MYRLYNCFLPLYSFSTEELRLATGASAPVAHKKKLCICFYTRNSEGNVNNFNGFSKKQKNKNKKTKNKKQKKTPSENSQLSLKKVGFCPPPSPAPPTTRLFALLAHLHRSNWCKVN